MFENKLNKEFKRVIVTGASGFIGGALVKEFINQKIEVIAIDRKRNKEFNCKQLSLDLKKSGNLDNLIKSNTIIFHFSADANVSKSVENPISNFEDNVISTIQILESARKHKAALIFPSTAAVFDPGNNLPLLENSIIKPTSPYGASKIACEAYCYSYFRSYGLDVKIARLFNVYGEGMKRFAIFDIINKLLINKNNINILGDGTQIRDYLHIDDVIRGLILIANKGDSGEDYNLASGIPVNIIELTKKISDLLNIENLNINIVNKSFKGDINKWFADVNKIKKLGFEQKVNLIDGLTRTINYISKFNNSAEKN